MSDKPKLIGMITADIPWLSRNVVPGVDEMISRIAVDDSGGLWGLVASATRIETLPRGAAALLRVRYVRFHKLADVPFVSESPIEFFGPDKLRK